MLRQFKDNFFWWFWQKMIGEKWIDHYKSNSFDYDVLLIKDVNSLKKDNEVNNIFNNSFNFQSDNIKKNKSRFNTYNRFMYKKKTKLNWEYVDIYKVYNNNGLKKKNWIKNDPSIHYYEYNEVVLKKRKNKFVKLHINKDPYERLDVNDRQIYKNKYLYIIIYFFYKIMYYLVLMILSYLYHINYNI